MRSYKPKLPSRWVIDKLSNLSYEVDTGLLRWKISPSNNVKIGRVAGTINKSSGYVEIQFGLNNKKCLVRGHHIAWFLFYGHWPIYAIDHKDGNKANNKIDNLRYASQQQNMVNRPIRKDNTSGYTGIQITKTGKFQASIWNKKKWISLGTYEKLDDAINVRKIAESKLQPEFRRI